MSPAYESLVDGSGRFVPNRKVLELRQKLIKFMETHIYPMENEFYKLAQSDSRWTIHPEEERLKEVAKREGLWNLFIPVCIFFSTIILLLLQVSESVLMDSWFLQVDSAARARRELAAIENKHGFSGRSFDQLFGEGLTNLEYGYLCEIMGRSVWAPQVFNCGAPDTGNMEVKAWFCLQVQKSSHCLLLKFI